MLVFTPEISYVDFGRATLRNGQRNQNARSRPYCDLCGPFAGRFMRQLPGDEHGAVWRCKGCDEEGS